MESYFNKSIEDTMKRTNTHTDVGLKASEVQKRLEEFGPNRLAAEKAPSIFRMFLAQFKDFLVIILLIAAVISMVVGLLEGDGILDSIIIFSIVIINAVIGVSQESRANNALKALKDMSSPQAKVLREGTAIKIPSDEIVPGDVILLDAGDYVPADLRLVESINLKIDESALTGESLAVEKDSTKILAENTVVGDRINSAYMGTVVTYGRGRGIATGTGMNTQMGGIAVLLNEAEEETTPLQKKLDSLGKSLGIICLAVCAAIFALGIYHGDNFIDIFMVSVSLAVAAIPEGLTVVVTVILALGMQHMVKSNAIIKKLSAVETLGSTTVICSDKTGTLTQNKMTVVKLYDTENTYTVSGTGYSPDGQILNELNPEKALTKNVEYLIQGAVLCNDAVYDSEKQVIIGDPTEGAMLVLGEKANIYREEINKNYKRIQEIPFDSDRKLMSTFHQKDQGVLMVTKGAPDELIRRSAYIYKDGKVFPMTEAERENILNANTHFAENALRVLGVSYREFDEIKDLDLKSQENDLIYLGLLCMIDPPREEVKPAVIECHHAGINVKMITGDHKVTAGAIAKDLGIMAAEEEALEGREIEQLSDEELQEKVKKINVFARVSPEHKVRLVTAVKKNGHIVAMTGDGVNDAPSLKKADIGIAMGITGTDVSKEAADMILTDDNFVSIVGAVEEGRTIYNNIRKVVGYLLSCNIGEILLIFSAMAVNLPTPLKPIHLLSINLITDAFPAFALGMEEKEDGVMDAKPRDPNESIVNKKMGIAVFLQSVFLAVGALVAFLIGLYYYEDLEVGTTLCFATLVTGELFRAYSARSEKTSIFKMKLFSNSYLNKCVLLSLIFLFAVIYIPFMHVIFLTEPLSLAQLAIALCLAILPVIGGEIAKVIGH